MGIWKSVGDRLIYKTKTSPSAAAAAVSALFPHPITIAYSGLLTLYTFYHTQPLLYLSLHGNNRCKLLISLSRCIRNHHGIANIVETIKPDFTELLLLVRVSWTIILVSQETASSSAECTAGISRHSALSEDRIRQWVTSSGSRRKDTDQCL